ncbi:MAG: serine/threonine-protein kinase [Polyangiales bacterium]
MHQLQLPTDLRVADGVVSAGDDEEGAGGRRLEEPDGDHAEGAVAANGLRGLACDRRGRGGVELACGVSHAPDGTTTERPPEWVANATAPPNHDFTLPPPSALRYARAAAMSATPSDAAPAPGDVIGERYRIVRTLGAGGIGVVCEAENTWTRRRVAIKLLQAKTADDPEQLERFRVEAQTTSALRHPNIVDVLDMGPDGATGRLFIIQELLQGQTLHALIDKRQPLTARAAFDLIVPVMGALVAAHAKGVLHRDIKPSNIFLAADEHGEVTPKLIDFGLAKVLHEDAERHKTRTGSIVGTPYYMAPEQARGESSVDARIDVWAIGVVLFELLSGRVPFEGDNTLAVMWKIASTPAPRLDAMAPAVPAAVADIVGKALANQRDGRYPTMAAFLEDVLACRALAEPGAPTLAALYARSLPPSLAARPSRPEAPAKVVDGVAMRPTVPASEPDAQQPDLRTTPFGWASSPDASTRRRSRYGVAAVSALAVAAVVAVAVRLRGPERAHSAASAAAVSAPLPVRPAAPIVDVAAPSAAPAPSAPPVVASAVPSAAPATNASAEASPSRVVPALRRRLREPTRATARAAAREVAPTAAPAATPTPARRSQQFDPERLLEDTR